MSENQTTLGQKLTSYIEKEYNSIFNFAKEIKIPTASFNYATKNNSFRLNILEEIGKSDEKILDVIINHFLSLRETNNFVVDNSPLLQENEDLKKEVGNLQQQLIDSNRMLINCQQQIINKK